ncbi:hypothetical protein [Burkholderia lata]|uniref:hypothetical protein n=1 Tax=Burkholderia lata (strain ATCC 17760 / DSM 23089 / LMG 22485 / NCIMB 9086 / R18194 / 383) TaxID=482957 RepID=UPI0015839301
MPDYRTPDLTIQAVYPGAWHVALRVRRFVDHLIKALGDAPPWDRHSSGDARRKIDGGS